MAAKTSLDSNNSITDAPLSAAPSSKDAQDFFQRVYTHLKEGRLQTALILIENEGVKAHKNLGGKNKQHLIASLGKEGLTPDQRADLLVSTLKKFQQLFPGVKPENFERVRMQMRFSSAIASHSSAKAAAAARSTTDDKDHSETLKKVKNLGVQAGLSEKEVDKALEKIVLEDGRQIWIIKTEHTEQANAWQFSLISLASHEELILFSESYIRSDRADAQLCNSRNLLKIGLFRGLETDVTNHHIYILTLYLNLLEDYGKSKALKAFTNSLMELIYNCTFQQFPKETLARAASQSKAAALIFDAIQKLPIDKISLLQFPSLAEQIVNKVTHDEWENFIRILASESFPATKSPDLVIALRNLLSIDIASISSLEPREIYPALYDRFLEEWRKVRDPQYASMVKDELPKLPKDKPVFVFFGGSHAPGFKEALLAPGTKSTEKKSEEGDSKRND